MTENIISATNLVKIYTARDSEVTALDGVTLKIDKGEYVAVMGPTGSGKSTLLNIIGLIDQWDSGEYRFMGENMGRCSEKKRTALRKDNISFIFQDFNLIDEMSIFENVEMALFHFEYSESERRRKVSETLEMLDILHFGRFFPRQLSGGEKQRAAVARALVAHSGLILADEPTGKLDEDQADKVMGILEERNRTGTTIVMATHSEKSAGWADRILRLLDGRIIWENL